jgi:C-terminal processing protease CtpA/Prc
VNNGTVASAKITAGAIHDYQKQILVETKPYVKGTIQSWIAHQGENGAVQIMVARLLTPKGRLLEIKWTNTRLCDWIDRRCAQNQP